MVKSKWRKSVDRKNFTAWETPGGKNFVYVSKQFIQKQKDWELNLDDKRRIYTNSKAEALKKARYYMRSH